MKKLTLYTLLILFNYKTYSQSAPTPDGSTFTHENNRKHNFGLSVAINSIQGQVEVPLMTGGGTQIIDADGNILAGGNRIDKSYSFSIIPKYYINNDILLRFEFGMMNLHSQANLEEKLTFEHGIYKSEVTNKIYRYGSGFQWVFMRKKKIESYCGMTASYINYKYINTIRYSESRERLTDTLQSWGNVKETTPGGFALGFGALAGFNVYLHKRISLGAELSSSALYYKLGGDSTVEDTEFNVSGPNPSITYNYTYTNSYRGFKISKIISSFNITFWL